MSDATKIPYDRLPDETDTAFLARAIMTLARVTEEKGGSIVTELATLARVAEEQGDAIATELGSRDGDVVTPWADNGFGSSCLMGPFRVDMKSQSIAHNWTVQVSLFDAIQAAENEARKADALRCSILVNLSSHLFAAPIADEILRSAGVTFDEPAPKESEPPKPVQHVRTPLGPGVLVDERVMAPGHCATCMCASREMKDRVAVRIDDDVLDYGGRTAALLPRDVVPIERSIVDWSIMAGRYDVRASCAAHPTAKLERVGRMGRCQVCCALVELCLDTFGLKECVLVKNHGGDYHTSASASSWPIVGPTTTANGGSCGHDECRLCEHLRPMEVVVLTDEEAAMLRQVERFERENTGLLLDLMIPRLALGERSVIARLCDLGLADATHPSGRYVTVKGHAALALYEAKKTPTCTCNRHQGHVVEHYLGCPLGEGS